MPMNTMLDRRPGAGRPSGPGSSPSRMAAAADLTCSTISAVDRLRCNPPWPVAQNGQAMPQPAWLDTHSVVRSG